MTGIPAWEGFMIPLLRSISDGSVYHRREITALTAEEMHLTDEQRALMLPSGRKVAYVNRIGWAISFFTKVGALDRPSRGHYTITETGRILIKDFPNGVTEYQLKKLGSDPNSPIQVYEPSYSRIKSSTQVQVETEEESLTPLEQVQQGISRIEADVAQELLKRLQGEHPEFFEQAVVDLLLAMGYGGTHGKGIVTPYSNDGGIDGVIDQDALGISRVYVQAKRYASNNFVGRRDLQSFVGAISGKADSGVFITTSGLVPVRLSM